MQGLERYGGLRSICISSLQLAGAFPSFPQILWGTKVLQDSGRNSLQIRRARALNASDSWSDSSTSSSSASASSLPSSIDSALCIRSGSISAQKPAPKASIVAVKLVSKHAVPAISTIVRQRKALFDRLRAEGG